MGGPLKWMRKKWKKADGFRKEAKKFFGGKKQKDDRLNLLDQSEFDDDTSSFEYTKNEKGYRNIMVTQDWMNILHKPQEPKEPCKDGFENALEQNLKHVESEKHAKSEHTLETGNRSICKLSHKSTNHQVAAKIVLKEDVGEREFEDPPNSFEHDKSDQGYRNIMVTQNLTYILPKPEEPNEPLADDWIQEALEPLKSEYTFETCFARGGNGSICKLSNNRTKYQVAAKIVLKEDVGDFEADLWAILKHPNILPLLLNVTTAKCQVFLSPLMEGCLEEAVYNRKVTFAQLRHYLQGALQGLNHLHANGMCHLDVKGDNVLIGGGKGVLCDFGFVAPKFSALNNYSVGMPDKFRPPEASIHLGWEAPVPSGEACDKWGCGIMLNELGSNFPLLYAEPEEENWEQHVYPVLQQSLQSEAFVARVQSTFNDVDTQTALILRDLILNFLEIEPTKRMNIETALQHPFFWEQLKP